MKEYAIIPTKKNPVFIAYCSDFGRLDGIYKGWRIGYNVGDTYALNLPDAMRFLFEFIKENEAYDNKTRYEIEMVDGSLNKHGEVYYKKVYSITESKAKKYKVKY
jgi:hypothetical protein